MLPGIVSKYKCMHLCSWSIIEKGENEIDCYEQVNII